MSKGKVTLKTKEAPDRKSYSIVIEGAQPLTDELVIKTLIHLCNKIAGGKEDCNCKGEKHGEAKGN